MTQKLQELLEEGRRVLSKKEEQTEQEAAEYRDKIDRIFGDARRLALELFAPLGGELLVQPCTPREGWDPDRHSTDRNLWFYIAPFEAAKITVRLQTRWDNEQIIWVQQDSRSRYYVEKGHYPRDGDLRPIEDVGTNSLAEALALCERETKNYRNAAERLQQAKDERPKKPRQPTVDERLIQALTDWHATLEHEGQG